MFVEQALARETECVRAQRHPVTSCVYSAVDVITALIIVDLVAVADVQPVLGAVPPNCVLHEPREDFWKMRVELASIKPTEYRLTAAGRELQRIIDLFGEWGARWAFGPPRPTGRVDLQIGGSGMLEQMRSGQVRGLAVTTARRSRLHRSSELDTR